MRGSRFDFFYEFSEECAADVTDFAYACGFKVAVGVEEVFIPVNGESINFVGFVINPTSGGSIGQMSAVRTGTVLIGFEILAVDLIGKAFGGSGNGNFCRFFVFGSGFKEFGAAQFTGKIQILTQVALVQAHFVFPCLVGFKESGDAGVHCRYGNVVVSRSGLFAYGYGSG